MNKIKTSEAHGDINADEFNEAIRILEEADHQAIIEEEPVEGAVVTRSRANPQRFQLEQDADRYAEYVAMGCREPEPQDIGRVIFYRGFRRTEGNLIKAKETLRNSYLSRHEANVEPANIYFDEAMKDKPDAA